MRIIGIDPGYATTGFGIIENTGSVLSAVDYGVITTPKDESIPVRLAMLNETLEKLIKDAKPDAISIEELFFNTNITTGIKVAEARGVILLCSIKHCGRLFEYTPLQVKQAITGNGRAEKRQLQYMVKAILRLKTEPKPDDAADALAVAICHYNMHNHAHRILS